MAAVAVTGAREFKNLIGGWWVGAVSGETFESLVPATGEALGTFPRSGAEGEADPDLATPSPDRVGGEPVHADERQQGRRRREGGEQREQHRPGPTEEAGEGDPARRGHGAGRDDSLARSGARCVGQPCTHERRREHRAAECAQKLAS